MPVIDCKLPYHQSEACFRKYEPFILSSVLRHPESITLVGFQDLSLTTFIARLRDSRASHKKYNWPSKIPRAEFLSTYNDIKVWQKDGKIIMGTKKAVAVASVSEQIATITNTFILEDISVHELPLLIRLAAAGQLKNPIQFNYLFYKGQLQTILDQHDIDIEHVEGETFIIT